MRIQINMRLTKVARSKGGDRYDGELDSGDRLNLYLPQEYSRAEEGIPSETIKLAIETS